MKKNNTEKNKNAKIGESLITFKFSNLSNWQKFKLIISALFIIIFTIAFIQNFSAVNVKFLFWNFNLSVSLLIMICSFIGFIIAFIREERKILKKNMRIQELERMMKKDE